MAETVLSALQRYQGTPEVAYHEAQSQLEIKEGDVTKQMLHQSSRFLYWDALSGLAHSDTESAKTAIGEVEAETEARIRENARKKQAKITDQATKSMVANDEQVRAAKRHLENSRRLAGVLKAIARAFEQRYGLLQSVNSRQCKELALYSDDPARKWGTVNEQHLAQKWGTMINEQHLGS